MTLYTDRILAHIGELINTAITRIIRPVTVNEVYGDMVRLNFGKPNSADQNSTGFSGGSSGDSTLSNNQSNNVVGPWVPRAGLSLGGIRQSGYIKPNQQGWCISPFGDPSQAFFIPGMQNKHFLRPDHAPKPEKNSAVCDQIDWLRIHKDTNNYVVWFQEPKQNQYANQDLNEMPEPEPDGDFNKAKAVLHVSKDKDGNATIYGLVGKHRFQVNKDGAKLKSDNSHVVVTSDKVVINGKSQVEVVGQNMSINASTPIRVSRMVMGGGGGADPISNFNNLTQATET